MHATRSIIVTTALFMAGFWAFGATVDVLVFHEQTFGDSLLRPGRHHLFLRVTTMAMILAGGILWARYLRRLGSMQKDLVTGEIRYRTLVESSPECVLVLRGQRILFANRRTFELVGARGLDAIGDRGLFDFIHPDDHGIARKRLEHFGHSWEAMQPFELRMVARDGTVVSVLAGATPITYDEQSALLVFLRDISDEVGTRRELLASRDRLSLALEAARDGVWDWDILGGAMVYNRAWAAMLGRDLKDVRPDRSTWLQSIHPNDRERVETLLQAHLRGEIPNYETEVRLRHARGHYIWVIDRGRVVERDPAGRPLRMTGTHRDITARKEAEIALEIRNCLAEAFLTCEGSKLYSEVLDQLCRALDSPAGLFGTFDHVGNLRVVASKPHSTQLQHVVPHADLDGHLRRTIEQQLPTCEPGDSVLAGSGHPVRGTLVVPITSRDTVLGVVEVANRPEPYGASDQALLASAAGYLAPILQSYLSNESTETQLRQAQKMEALGVLAGGIAHDFNNILQAIHGFASLAADAAPPGDHLRHDLDRILKAAKRGEDLVRRILLFSRREEQEMRPLDVVSLVQEAVDFLRPAVAGNVRVVADMDPEAGQVIGDPSQLHQVLLNLATNAAHAMEPDGGTMTFTVRRYATGDRRLELHAFLRDKDLVAITLGDTGCGIDPNTLDRLFDPFFTTKEVGRGTGLGLSMVHGIVVAHGGDVHIDSEPGHGTSVTIFLPCQGPSGATADTHVAATVGRILLVEDDTKVAKIAASILVDGGHDVVVRHSGEEALATLHDPAQHLDLVVTDVLMPGISGLQVAKNVATMRPDLPVLLVAGSGEDLSRLTGWRQTPSCVVGVVQKPFNGPLLRHAISRALNPGISVPGDDNER